MVGNVLPVDMTEDAPLHISRSLLVTVLSGLVVTACTAGSGLGSDVDNDPPVGAGASTTDLARVLASTLPELPETGCGGYDDMIDASGSGAATRAAAADDVLREEGIADALTSVDGQDVLLGDVAIGEVEFFRLDDGTWAVSSISYCVTVEDLDTAVGEPCGRSDWRHVAGDRDVDGPGRSLTSAVAIAGRATGISVAGARVEGRTLVRDGEVIAEVELIESPAGGWHVTGISGCPVNPAPDGG